MSRYPIKIDDDLLRKLWPSRLPDKVLVERMNHTRGALYRRAKTIGLERRRDIWAKEEIRE